MPFSLKNSSSTLILKFKIINNINRIKIWFSWQVFLGGFYSWVVFSWRELFSRKQFTYEILFGFFPRTSEIWCFFQTVASTSVCLKEAQLNIFAGIFYIKIFIRVFNLWLSQRRVLGVAKVCLFAASLWRETKPLDVQICKFLEKQIKNQRKIKRFPFLYHM